MTSANENIRQLEGLFREDGAGGLLVCYETGREKPHADSSYQLYPVDPDRKDMTCQFLSLLHVGVETARISAFIPDTRMEVYRFPACPAFLPFSGYPRQSISPACCCPISKGTGWSRW